MSSSSTLLLIMVEMILLPHFDGFHGKHLD